VVITSDGQLDLQATRRARDRVSTQT
jgi:hypothetical protein